MHGSVKPQILVSCTRRKVGSFQGSQKLNKFLQVAMCACVGIQRCSLGYTRTNSRFEVPPAEHKTSCGVALKSLLCAAKGKNRDLSMVKPVCYDP